MSSIDFIITLQNKNSKILFSKGDDSSFVMETIGQFADISNEVIDEALNFIGDSRADGMILDASKYELTERRLIFQKIYLYIAIIRYKVYNIPL